MKNIFNQYWTIIVAAGSLALLGFIFVSIDPRDRPVALIFVPILLLWASLMLIVRFIFSSLLVGKTSVKILERIGYVCVSFLVLMILMSGVGQLTIRDFLLVSSLLLIASFYFYRSWG